MFFYQNHNGIDGKLYFLHRIVKSLTRRILAFCYSPPVFSGTGALFSRRQVRAGHASERDLATERQMRLGRAAPGALLGCRQGHHFAGILGRGTVRVRRCTLRLQLRYLPPPPPPPVLLFYCLSSLIMVLVFDLSCFTVV